MPYDSEIFVPTLGRSKRTVRAKLQFYLPKKSFVWTISPTKQPHQIEVIKFWKTCWMKWDFGEDFCFSDLVSNLKKSQCPTVLFFSRQDEYVRNSPKFPNFTQKKHHQLEGQFLSSFSREFFNGRFEDFPLVFCLFVPFLIEKTTLRVRIWRIFASIWVDWVDGKKGWGGLGSWRNVKYGVPVDMQYEQFNSLESTK